MLDARSVGKRFGGTDALRDVTFFLDRGVAAAVLGGNGAGKTTLLRIAAGLDRPTSGEMRLGGLDPARDGAAVRARLGYAGHEAALYDDLTLRENVLFVASFHLPADRARAATDAAVAEVGLADRADDRAAALSRGMRQRAALARALAHDPAVILLDEPFGSLDADAAALVETALARRKAAGATILFTTHDRGRLGLADRVLSLDGGRLAEARA